MKLYEIKVDFVELSKRYAGRWVALHPDTYEVVGVGNSAEEVLAAASRIGIEEPIITDVVDSYGSYVPCLVP